MPSHHRSQALFELARALQSVRDPVSVASVFATRAHQFSNGRMSIWRWDRERDLLVGRSPDFETERKVAEQDRKSVV